MVTKLSYKEIPYSRASVYEENIAFAPIISNIEFNILSKIWKEETSHLSIKSEKYLHPAYKDIISMGWEAVPYILDELDKEPYFWLQALREITNENPVKEQNQNNFQLMIEDWKEWGENKYQYETPVISQ